MQRNLVVKLFVSLVYVVADLDYMREIISNELKLRILFFSDLDFISHASFYTT